MRCLCRYLTLPLFLQHVHHSACAIAASVNMQILRNSRSSVLREAMLDAFHVLLADEVVTPGFNAWAFLKEFNRNRGALLYGS